ncbi:MAG: S1 RNA-binding domain-containing protein [Lachnospiraceae bacterium]|nr:S1 RNA-binding domain-containing protein [Candidatus Equihabitans merdae]
MESMDDYLDMLDASFRDIRRGDIVDCQVVGISDTEVTVDLQYNCAGIIRSDELSGDPSFSIKSDVQIGDTFQAEVISMDDGRGNLLLSKKRADNATSWDRFGEMMDNKTVVDMKITEAVKAGVIGYIDGSRIFVPASKLALDFVENTDEWVGQTISVRMITVDPENERLVASARDVLRDRIEEKKSQMVSNLQVGLITEGTVETLQPYGAFVSIGNGLSGLVHISQITSTKRLKHPKEALATGDKVKVKVIAVKDGKISLSIKDAEDREAEAVTEETVEIPEAENLATSLGSLLAGLKL